jgi:hypothetical protein
VAVNFILSSPKTVADRLSTLWYPGSNIAEDYRRFRSYDSSQKCLQLFSGNRRGQWRAELVHLLGPWRMFRDTSALGFVQELQQCFQLEQYI